MYRVFIQLREIYYLTKEISLNVWNISKNSKSSQGRAKLMILLMWMNRDLEWLRKPVLEQNHWWCEGERLCVHQMSPQRLTRSLTSILWLLCKALKILWTTFKGNPNIRRSVVCWRNVSNGARIPHRVYKYVQTAWKPAKTSFPCPKMTETHHHQWSGCEHCRSHRPSIQCVNWNDRAFSVFEPLQMDQLMVASSCFQWSS
jgi:hypothetical protein